MENDTKYSIATLILIVPLIFIKVYFLQEIWNIGVISIFNQLPILTYKTVFILYFIKGIFGLDIHLNSGYFIEYMYNKKYSHVKTNFYSMISESIFYFFIWLIVIKILL